MPVLKFIRKGFKSDRLPGKPGDKPGNGYNGEKL